MLKYLRIAVTALSLTACLLLIALWVRSYRYLIVASCPLSSGSTVNADIQLGRYYIYILQQPKPQWQIMTREIDAPTRTSIERLREQETALGFGAFRQLAMSVFIVPHWFLVVVTVTAAALPWLRWRFSLRTLLIATTLVAVVLGLVVLTV